MPRQGSPDVSPLSPREANPRAPDHEGRRIILSLPVGTDMNVLRSPVSADFRQKDGPFLLPLRDWPPQRPEMAAK